LSGSLRNQTNDLALRQRFIEQLDRCAPTHVERRDRSRKNHETAHRQDGENIRNLRHGSLLGDGVDDARRLGWVGLGAGLQCG
jgi:hypothetical protein